MEIKVIDTYSNGEFAPAKWVGEGYSGVIFKAGQGAWADVPRYRPDWWVIAKSYGLLRGWYWLCDSRQHSSAHINEMEKFGIFRDLGELGLWVDVEKPMISMTEATYWKTKYAGHTNLVDFAYLLELRGVVPGIYTGPGAYELVTRKASKSYHDYLGKFDLWTAQYYNNYIPGVSKPRLYGSWKKWVWWQWREGPDINIFNGTAEEFAEKYATNVPSTPGEGDEMVYQTSSSYVMSLREEASVTSPKIGSIPANEAIFGDSIWRVAKDSQYAKAGDSWLHTPKGWVAIVHMGKRYCHDPYEGQPNPNPTPPLVLPTRVVLEYEGKEYGYVPE